MPALLFAVAVLFGTTSNPLTIVDESGKAIVAASVDFIDTEGRHDVEKSDAAGKVFARASFEPLEAEVTAEGFVAQHIDLRNVRGTVVLVRSLPVVGSVSVATGSLSNLHELPLAASLLDRSAIALSPSLTSDGLLRQLPGFDRDRSNSAFTNYGQLRVSFLGAGTDLGAVFVDSLPAQDGFGGQVDWLAYPVQTLQSAELLRGAGSALYGSGAVGGVLDVKTFAPTIGSGLGVEGRAALAAGTNSSYDDGAQVSVPIGTKLAASFSTVGTGMSYYALPPGYAAPSDHISIGTSSSSNVKLRYDDGLTSIEASTLFSWDHQDEGRTNYTFNRNLNQDAVVASRVVGADLVKFWFYDRSVNIVNIDDLFPTDPGALRYTQNVPTHEEGYAASLDAPLSSTTSLDVLFEQRYIGGYSEQQGPTGALQADGFGTQIAQAAGLQATFKIPRFELIAGARADLSTYNDLTLINVSSGITMTTSVPGYQEGAVSPRGALRYDLTPVLSVRLSSGGGFRTPYLNELVRGYNIGKVAYEPNPFLVPERSTTDDAGLDYLIGLRGRLAFDVFQTKVNDAIDFVTISPTLMKRENIEQTQSNGETLTYTERLGSCTRLSVWGNAQNPRIVTGPGETPGKQLSYVPNSSAGVTVDGAGNGPFSFSLQGSYVGQTYADSQEQEPLGAALLFGATLRVALLSGPALVLTSDNLTHQQYLSTIDRFGPPRTIQLGVAVPLGQAAAPRATACGRSLH
jgi:outer membrane receptor protein involved in Fe transport